ncbi:unnamed protein product [Camellia sinensis]
MACPYPFFGFTSNTLDYALFKPNGGIFDHATGMNYTNMFDAQLDAIYSVMKRLGYDDVDSGGGTKYMEVDPRDHCDKEEKIASISPWKRKRPERRGPYKIVVHSFWEKFDDDTYANMDLDIDTKKTALKASPSVVSVVSLTGGNALFMGSGTIIDCENVNGTYFSTILTSASLLRSSAELEAVPEDIKIDVYISDGKLFEGRVFAYDFHFNIAFIKIESNATLPTASLRLLEDSISIDPNDIPGSDSFQLRPHSNVSKLCPGDIVVAVGRFFDAPYNLMAARGQFSLDCCKFDCKELFRIRIATGQSKWETCPIAPQCFSWNVVVCVVSKYGNFCRPWLGMEMTNLYAASVDKLERIIQKFPNIVKGVLVEKVIKESPAEHAGICQGDVIVRCSENFVQSILEFYGIIWDKVGKSVEVVVIRERSDALLNLTMVVDETSADKFNSGRSPKDPWYLLVEFVDDSYEHRHGIIESDVRFAHAQFCYADQLWAFFWTRPFCHSVLSATPFPHQSQPSPFFAINGHQHTQTLLNADDLPRLVQGDSSSVGQIFANLINDSSKVMELSFEQEFPNDGDRLLLQQRPLFYDRMKQVVVLIETILKPGLENPSVTESESSKCKYSLVGDPSNSVPTIHGGGVILNKEGFVLTCAHILPVDLEMITLRRVNEEEFWLAELVSINREWDLALVRVIDSLGEGVEFNFAKFGNEDLIDIGMEVYGIAHPGDIYYSLVVGQVAFLCHDALPPPPSPSLDRGARDRSPSVSPRSRTPNSRMVGDIIAKEDVELHDLHKKLNVIQVNNFHGMKGSSGAPIFDSHGRIIGIYSFILKNFDFGVHLTTLRKFCQDCLPQPSTKHKVKDTGKRKTSSLWIGSGGKKGR